MNKEIFNALTTPINEFPSKKAAREALRAACAHNDTALLHAIEYNEIMDEIGELRSNEKYPGFEIKKQRIEYITGFLLEGEDAGKF